MKPRIIASVSALAAFSAVLQLLHIGYQSPQWGMWIDFVSVSWLVAYLLYGLKPALLVTLISGLVITLFAPDTWLGASMKIIATVPMIFSLYFFQMLFKGKNSYPFVHFPNVIIPTLISLTVRSALMLPLNYYYAIPVWTGMSSTQAITAIPWYIIVFFNTLQGILELILAWLIVFRFGLKRFSATS